MVVSIIIVSWNTRDLLIQCIESICKNASTVDYEIWIVDNASEDGSIPTIREAFPSVNIIENLQNVGFGRANNQGIGASSGRYILLLNSDTRICPGAINVMLECMENHPEAGGIGPQLLNPDQSLQVSCYPFPTLTRECWRLFHLDTIKPIGIYDQRVWNLNQIREVDALKGACILFRREAIQQAGGFDPDFFMYTEEIDLCYRVNNVGWKLFWVPQAEVIHYGGQSTRLIADKMFLSLYRTKVLFFSKHYGRIAANAYKMILFFASLPRVAIGLFVWLEPVSSRKEHLSLVKRYLSLIAEIRYM